MKSRLGPALIFAAMVFLLPLLALPGAEQKVQLSKPDVASSVPKGEPAAPPGESGQASEQPAGTALPEAPAARIADDGFLLRDARTGKVFEVSAADFVRGAVAAEMPPTFHPEALKAQAVAAHTYALRRKQQARDAGQDYDFPADPENWKVYTDEKRFRERYGDLADAYWAAVAEAADEVKSYVLVHGGEPIAAAYHSMSSGRTEDAANVWLAGEPYLTPVESFGDTLAPDYRTSVGFSAGELSAALQKAFPDADLSGDPSGWLEVLERSPSGYVTSARVGGAQTDGMEVRTALGLRSSDFTVSYEDGAFTFKVVGYGHGVGLSQYGADYLARQGARFDEILLHYYQGASLAVAGGN